MGLARSRCVARGARGRRALVRHRARARLPVTKRQALRSAREVVRSGHSVELYSRRGAGAPPHAARAWTWRKSGDPRARAELEALGYRLEHSLYPPGPAQRALVL